MPVVAGRDDEEILLAVVVEVAALEARAGDVDVVGRRPHPGRGQARACRRQDPVVGAARASGPLGGDDERVVAPVVVEVAGQEP